jgi:hypothetical protein
MSLMGVRLKFHGCPACKACSKVILLTTQRGGQTVVSVVSWTLADGLDPGVCIYVSGQDNWRRTGF